jgi:magnesium-transporting ATPase (P-type)
LKANNLRDLKLESSMNRLFKSFHVIFQDNSSHSSHQSEPEEPRNKTSSADVQQPDQDIESKESTELVINVKSQCKPDKKGDEHKGLTSAEVEGLYKKYGYNELPHERMNVYWIFFKQFTGILPYTLEFTALIAIGVQSYPEFAIIVAILIANTSLGFREQLKAKKDLAINSLYAISLQVRINIDHCRST